MIPNGEKMDWNGHHLVFDIPCRGCFFADKDSCPDCDEGLWVEEKPSPWHTGTPTEEGEYLIKYRYPQLGVSYDVAQYPAPIWKMNIIEKWQNIEETD